jgi:hypothetical protein
MQTLVISDSVRFRVGKGEASFFDPINSCFQTNETYSNMWVTLHAGDEIVVVGAYEKGTTYFLLCNEHGTGLCAKETFGMVVRQLSMEKILRNVLVSANSEGAVDEDESSVAA